MKTVRDALMNNEPGNPIHERIMNRIMDKMSPVFQLDVCEKSNYRKDVAGYYGNADYKPDSDRIPDALYSAYIKMESTYVHASKLRTLEDSLRTNYVPVMREVRAEMEHGSPSEYAVSKCFGLKPDVAAEVTKLFMQQLRQVNPDLPAHEGYDIAMSAALQQFRQQNHEMLPQYQKDGTALEISLMQESLKAAQRDAQNKVTPIWQRVAERTWEIAANGLNVSPAGKSTFVALVEQCCDKSAISFEDVRTADSIAEAIQKFNATDLSTMELRAGFEAGGIAYIDTIGDILTEMKQGTLREYAAAQAFGLPDSIKNDIIDSFIMNMQHQPDTAANRTIAMIKTVDTYIETHPVGPESLQNGTSLSLADLRASLQEELRELGVNERDDIGDDTIGDDE